ncbi:MAG: ribbon-helix-helix protein, CopG family [Cyanobacteria bacterium SBLK]|nr:ribbon-helix-helix protein, CopG family [Cyanobacteria bacterium SBLK]
MTGRAENKTYGEKKKPTTLTLTPTAVEYLDNMAEGLHLSRSELVEQFARGLLATNISKRKVLGEFFAS